MVGPAVPSGKHFPTWQFTRIEHRPPFLPHSLPFFRECTLFELARGDLNALRWAVRFVSDDEKRPVLQAICLDAGGRVVATNGAKLLLRTCSVLKEVAAPVLLGPWPEGGVPEGDRAELSIDGEEGVLRVGGAECRAPVMEGPYVKYEQVIPTDTPECRATVAASEVLEAIDLIDGHLAPRHPVDPEGPWRYVTMVELRLSGPEQTLSMATWRDMGYTRKDRGGKEVAHPGGPDWTFVASVPAEVEVGGPEEFRIWLNPAYWKEAVCALEADTLDLRFMGPLKPVVCTPEGEADQTALVMPLRMETG